MVLVCVWPILLSRGPQAVWDHGSPVLWDCHVTLYSFQPLSCHTSHCTTNYAECVVYGRYSVCVCVCVCMCVCGGGGEGGGGILVGVVQ